MEVIFVNSNSNDNSSKILDEWISKNQQDYKMKFYNINTNTYFPSSSKNAGVKLSKYKRLAFMDCG